MVAEEVGWWKLEKDVEGSRADGTSRERGCPGPGGPRLFSSRREESGSFYFIVIRNRYCDTVPVLRSSALLTDSYCSLFRLSLGRSVTRIHSPRLLSKRGTSCTKLYKAMIPLPTRPTTPPPSASLPRNTPHGRCPSSLFCTLVESLPRTSP